MLKKTLSVLLAVLMVVSVLTVGVVTAGAADYSGVTTDSTKLYFDANSTGWEMAAKEKIGFYVFPLGDDVAQAYKGWGGKRLQGTDADGDGIWEYDPKNFKLEDGVQYKIIFTHCDAQNSVIGQTYDLFFDTTCLGKIAYANGTEYENPSDSAKKTLGTFWDGMDSNLYGPVLQVSSIGNVLGTCVEQGKTKLDIFNEFVTVINSDTGTTVLDNAIHYVVEPGKKTEQQLIDDIGAGLELTKDDVQKVFTDSGVDTGWKYDDSTLPGGEIPHEHTPGEPVQENVVPATCQAEGSYDEVIYCTECEEELSRETKTIAKLDHTPGEPVEENVVPATCQAAGSYDKVVYCTVCNEELSRETIEIGKLLHTPGEPVEENVVPATCQAEGSYDEVVYCTVCNEELSRETKTIDKLDHTPGEAVRENEVEADCENAGGYDEVVYCTECKEELSRTHIDVPALGHDIVFVEEVPATASTDGMKAHYECTRCGKLYADASGNIEVSAEDLIIKAEHKRGDVNMDGEVDIIDATIIQRVLAEIDVEVYDEIAADADLDGIVDMIDVTLIQRIDAQMTTFEKWDAAHAA